MITPPLAQKRIAVRAPFRVLAALVWLCALVAFLGMAYVAWKGGQSLPTKDVVVVPGMLWLFRLVFHAALDGKAPEDAHWPFASSQVATGYLLCVMIFQGWI